MRISPMAGGLVRSRSRSHCLSGAEARPRSLATSWPGRSMHRFCIYPLPAVEAGAAALMSGDLPVLGRPGSSPDRCDLVTVAAPEEPAHDREHRARDALANGRQLLGGGAVLHPRE